MSRSIYPMVFFLLYIWFFVDYFVFSITDFKFFEFQQNYHYNYQIAIKTLAFNLTCIAGYFLGASIEKTTKHNYRSQIFYIKEDKFRLIFRFFLILSIFISILFIINSDHQAGSGYFKQENSFLYEFRVFAILMLCLLIMNNIKLYRLDLFLILIYITLMILGKTRSILIEPIFILLCYFIIVKFRDKFKITYLVYGISLLIVINAIAYIRQYGSFAEISENLHYLLNFEYKMYLNLQVSEVLSNNYGNHLTFMDTFIYIFPSFIRKLLGIDLQYYEDQALFFEIGRASNPTYLGGFSFLAETYLNIGYFSFFLFFLFGYIISYNINSYKYNIINKQKGVILLSSLYPILIFHLILMLRNGFGPHIKYMIQMYIIFYFLIFISKKMRF
jgi:hypothetical protein